MARTPTGSASQSVEPKKTVVDPENTTPATQPPQKVQVKSQSLRKFDKFKTKKGV